MKSLFLKTLCASALALSPALASAVTTSDSGDLFTGLTSATRVNISTTLPTATNTTSVASAITSMADTGWYYGVGNGSSSIDLFSSDAAAGTVTVIGRKGYDGSYLAGTQVLSSLLTSDDAYVVKTLTSLTVSFDATVVTDTTKVSLYSWNSTNGATELVAPTAVATGAATTLSLDSVSLSSSDKLFLVLTDTSAGNSFTIGNLTAAGTVTTTDTTDAHTWANGTTEWTGTTLMADGETEAGAVSDVIFNGSTDEITVDSVTVSSIALKNDAAVSLSGGTLTAADSGLTFSGASGSTLSISSSVAGGALTIASGADVTLTGVRSSTSAVTVESGGALAVTGDGRLFNPSEYHRTSLTVRGHLTVDSVAYGSNLGYSATNSGYLILGAGGQITIDGDGSGSRGMTLWGDWRDWGGLRTIELTEGHTFTWKKDSNCEVVEGNSGTGANMAFLIQDGATLTFEADLLSSVGLFKRGSGELVVAGSASGARIISVENGTLSVSGTLTTAGETTLGADTALNITGTLKATTISLAEGSSLTVGENATLSATTLSLADGSSVDFGGHDSSVNFIADSFGIFSAAVTNAGTLSGQLTVNGDVSADDTELPEGFAGAVSASGSMELTLTQEMSGVRALSGSSALSISGSEGTEALEIAGVSGLSTAALYSDSGAVTLDLLGSVSLCDNSGSTTAGEDFFRAGAAAAADTVSVSVAGDITVSGNSVGGNSDAGGAIYGGNGISLVSDGGDITINGNSADDADNAAHGGALNGSFGDVSLSAANISITDNSTAGEGGAIYAAGSISIAASGTLTISGNNATGADGGAIVSEGELSITAGSGGVSISGNSAENGYGGALALNSGATLNLTAEDGSITFSENSDQDGANDVAFTSGGTANFTAAEEQNIALGSGLSVGEGEHLDLNINAGGEQGSVSIAGDLSGTSAGIGGGALTVGGSTLLTAEESITIAASGASFTTDTAQGALTVIGRGEEEVAISSSADAAVAISLDAADITFTNAAITVDTDGEVTVSATLESSSLSLSGGGSVIDNTNAELDAVTAEQSMLTYQNREDGLTIHSLTLGDGSTLSVYTGEVAGEENVAALTTENLTLSGSSHLDADLVMAGGSITVEAGATVTLGCTVSLSGDIRVVMSDEAISTLDSDGIVAVFCSVEGADIADSIVIYDSAENVTNYKLVYDVPSGTIYAAPEPATAALSLLALAGLCARRRRH